MSGAPQSSGPPPFRTRIQVLFATAAPVAVILRSGPKRHHQLLTWNLSEDTFVRGQWLKGLVRLMDLSPAGDKLIYWAAQYHPNAGWTKHRPVISGDEIGGFDPLQHDARALSRAHAKRPYRKLPRYVALSAPRQRPRENQGVWTAVSTPPWFSALAIWPAYGHWTGGGYFFSGRHIVLLEPQNGLTPIANVPIPAHVQVSSSADPALAAASLRTVAMDPCRQPGSQMQGVCDSLISAGVRYAEWAHLTATGDLLFACDGAIYRHKSWNGTTGPGLLSAAKRLIDLSDERFQQLRPPREAMRW